MKKLTNAEIVEDVYRTFQIKSLINKMIDYSVKDQSNGDLEQYIYEYLLTYDTIRLNQMYNDKKLRNFISKIILQQRNGGVRSNNTIYQTELRIKNSNEYWFERHDIPEPRTYEFTADIIIEYIDVRSDMVDGQEYNSDELKNILAFTLLKKYFMSDLTQKKLAAHLNLSRLTISKLLKIAREDTLKWWLNIGQYKDGNINYEL